MTQTKFTPAPWVVNLNVEDELIEIAMSSYIETPYSYYSCHKVSIEADDEEAIANAHLIAAAPEMYELLEKFKDFAIRDGWKHVLIEDAEKLLAKARGES